MIYQLQSQLRFEYIFKSLTYNFFACCTILPMKSTIKNVPGDDCLNAVILRANSFIDFQFFFTINVKTKFVLVNFLTIGYSTFLRANCLNFSRQRQLHKFLLRVLLFLFMKTTVDYTRLNVRMLSFTKENSSILFLITLVIIRLVIIIRKTCGKSDRSILYTYNYTYTEILYSTSKYSF